MINKTKVKKNFSRAAENYEKYTDLQKNMSVVLNKKIQQESKNYSGILDLGCGTGYLTEQLLDLNSGSAFDLVDISPEMIDFCKSKFSRHNNIRYFVHDAESVDTGASYDLIASNACFQWFKKTELSIQSILKSLKPCGILAFSSFGENTFLELHMSFKEAYKELKEPYIRTQGQEFLSINAWEKILKNNGTCSFEESIVKKYYKDVDDFLNTIRLTGAKNTGIKKASSISIRAFKKMKDFYQRTYMTNKGIPATYHIIYGVLKKNG